MAKVKIFKDALGAWWVRLKSGGAEEFYGARSKEHAQTIAKRLRNIWKGR